MNMCQVTADTQDGISVHVDNDHDAEGEETFVECPFECEIHFLDHQSLHEHLVFNHQDHLFIQDNITTETPKYEDNVTVVSSSSETDEVIDTEMKIFNKPLQFKIKKELSSASETEHLPEPELKIFNSPPPFKIKEEGSTIRSTTVPSIGSEVEWKNEMVDLATILLHACLVTAKENLFNLYGGKTHLKWSRSFAVEWLEKNIEGAMYWNRSTLNDRFGKSEKVARKFSMTKEMSKKTGMGDVDSLQDEKFLPAHLNMNKTPTTENERNMAKMITEFDQVKVDIRAFSVKRNKRPAETQVSSSRETKANEFLSSLSPMDEKINFKSNGFDYDRRVQITGIINRCKEYLEPG